MRSALLTTASARSPAGSGSSSTARECQRVADKFIARVPDWPWKPGQEQEAFRTLEERALLGLESRALFLSWMAQTEQVRMAN